MKPVPDGALVDDLRLREIVAVPRGVYGIDERERLLLEEMQLIARALLELRGAARVAVRCAERELTENESDEGRYGPPIGGGWAERRLANIRRTLRALLPEEGK